MNCPCCNKDISNIIRHLKRCHQDEKETIIKKCENEDCNNTWELYKWKEITIISSGFGNITKRFCCQRCKQIQGSKEYHRSEDINCPYCNKKLCGERSLKRHLRLNACLHNHICEKCNSKFTNDRSYKYHLTIDCLNLENKCKICDKYFNTINDHVFVTHKNLIQIIKVKCLNNKCNNTVDKIICGPYEKYYKKTCSNKCLSEVQSQNNQVEYLFDCHICNEKFSSEKFLNKHIKVRHLNKKFQCKYCNATYGHIIPLHRHYKQKHFDKQILNIQKCKNPQCNKFIKYYSIGTFRFKKSKFCCKQCVYKYINITTAQNYTMSYENRYKLSLRHNRTCKWYTYIHSNGTHYRVQGCYELAYAKKLDELGEKFVTHPKGIKYNNNGRDTFYFPDFYLPDKNIYVDTKSIYYLNLSGNKFELLKSQHPDISILIVTETDFINLGIQDIYKYVKDIR